MFLFDIYSDLSPVQAIMKPAQIGASTVFNIKPLWLMDKRKIDIIYTMPSDSDVREFVSSKTNRIIAQNPILQAMTKDRDTIEQKQVGNSIIYFRGTWTDRAAMTYPADLLIFDEVDASNQKVVEDYETRIKHSKLKWRWYLSHPSSEKTGVHKLFLQSDQKHWFIKCSWCNEKQYLSWPESINQELGIYVCKFCGKELTDDDRRRGEWVKKFNNRPVSGYWISSLMCPWVPAREIVENFNTKDAEYFYTKVLGLPYVGKGNKVTEDVILRNLTSEFNAQDGNIVIGVDTGTRIWYVVGNQKGIFHHGMCTDYNEIEDMLRRWPKAIAVFDQGGDLIAPRALREKYRGRVFLCHYRQDRKTMQLIKWGHDEEAGNVVVDRNRMIQLVVDELTDKRIPIFGNREEWSDLITHWSNMKRVEEMDGLGVMKKKWEREGDDHLVHAQVYWRVGMSKFGMGGAEITGDLGIIRGIQRGYSVSPQGKVPLITQGLSLSHNDDDDDD
jgi:hypothetical protein